MKKIASILLLFLFLITNSGIAVNAHWCGKKLASVHLVSDSKHPCSCSKKTMKAKCCKNKTTILKTKTDVAKARHLELKSNSQNYTFTVANYYAEILPAVNFEQTASKFYHPPPTKHRVPIYLLDKVFRI